MYKCQKIDKSENELFTTIQKSVQRLREFQNEICDRCVHRRYADECKNCFLLKDNVARLVNFFPCPYWTRDEILSKMSIKEIETYLSIRNNEVRQTN
jgi:hypothetical protein